jgi:hypothetical protein
VTRSKATRVGSSSRSSRKGSPTAREYSISAAALGGLRRGTSPDFEVVGVDVSEAQLRWLEPDGFFLASLGSGGSPDWTGEWLGVPIFFSGYDVETNRTLLREAGFELLLDDVVEMSEPEGEGAFLWVLAQKG